MEITVDHILLYFQGKLGTKELIMFREKMENSPDFKKEVDDMLFIWKTTEKFYLQRTIDTDTHWKKLSRKITFLYFRKKLWTGIRTGAAILILPLLMTTFYVLQTKNKDTTFINEIQTVTSSYGLISKIVLPDGSEAWLNSGSTLTYPVSFTKSERKVKLEGEAYFKVKSDKKNKFDVEMKNGLTVSAYGTEFNVRSYSDEPYSEAVLVKGNIMLSKDNDSGHPSHLKENQKGILYDDSDQIRISEANTYVTTAWKEGKMVFRRTGMGEVIKRLSRHFSVDIRLQDKSLNEYEYNATFTNESLVNILELLKQSAPITYRIIEPIQMDDGSFSRKQVIISKNKMP